jgi:ATP-dependent 26S proteasome regulatory subunit
MVESVTDPSFFNFITNWTMENGRNSILLIEDAEPLLSSRESTRNMGITNLLNLTDGILNDILSIQIIATFNTSLNDLDKALLRPERLIAHKEFTKLSKDNAKKLAEIIKVDPSLITKDITLAELYSIKNNNEVLIHGIDKKSIYDERSSIGFINHDK